MTDLRKSLKPVNDAIAAGNIKEAIRLFNEGIQFVCNTCGEVLDTKDESHTCKIGDGQRHGYPWDCDCHPSNS